MSEKSLAGIIILLVIILGLCAVMGYLQDSSDDKTEVKICTDSPITLNKFVDEVKTHEYFTGYNKTTLFWMESLDGNYMVFSSDDAYYIISLHDTDNLKIESVTDGSMYCICNCHIKETRPLADNLCDVKLISDVEYISQEFHSFDE